MHDIGDKWVDKQESLWHVDFYKLFVLMVGCFCYYKSNTLTGWFKYRTKHFSSYWTFRHITWIIMVPNKNRAQYMNIAHNLR
jgi:hypothetical protein